MAGVLRTRRSAQPFLDILRQPEVGPQSGLRAHHCKCQHRLYHSHVSARHRVRPFSYDTHLLVMTTVLYLLIEEKPLPKYVRLDLR